MPGLHYDIACAFQMLGRLTEAAAHYRHAIRLRPEHAEAHNNLANTLADNGLADEAVLHFDGQSSSIRALSRPTSTSAACCWRGDYRTEPAHFGRALGLNPNIAEAHANLGDVCLAQGRLHDAVERYQRALAVKPELAEAHNKLGVALAALGRFEEAARRFQAALTRKPDFIDAYSNLARTLLSVGQAQDALIVLKRALAVAETPEIKSLFVQCARCLPALPDADDFRAIMVRALSEPWGRANDLAPLAISLIRQDAAVRTCLDAATETGVAAPAPQELLGGEGFAAIANNRPLQCLLESAPVCDVGLERLLTRVRSAMLATASAAEGGTLADAADRRVLSFCCTLARQCFLNEYVFACTDKELGDAHRLRDSLLAALATGVAVPELIVAVVAAYVPLCSLTGADLLLDRTWSEPLTGVLTQQVREPAEERGLRASIPALTAIAHGVSGEVRRQYEENPYPRWSMADPPKRPLPIDQHLRGKFPASTFDDLGKRDIDVLIAGCGTGQHAIETAQRFAGARLLAVDLSRTSLAYAMRKTRALGRGNIEYAQADILALGSLGRSFDVIEVERRVASSCRAVRRVARAALAAAARRVHGDRPL